MKEYYFGSMSKRHAIVRFWKRSRPRFEWPEFSWERGNYRCYCPVGTSITLRVVLFGQGFMLFYSHYTGEIPCICDEILDELGAEDAAPNSHALVSTARPVAPNDTGDSANAPAVQP